jgi:hypothetical protein
MSLLATGPNPEVRKQSKTQRKNQIPSISCFLSKAKMKSRVKT